MREAVFLRNNEKKWLNIERKINDAYSFTTDELVYCFSDLSSDLSYAKSNYPTSKTTVYLNELCSNLYRGLYKKDTNFLARFTNFWKYEIPKQMWDARRAMIISFTLFFLATAVGVISTYFDPEFPRIILGNEYVDMTLKNIDEDKPMEVYNTMEEALMFFKITINNIRVAMWAFVSGLFFGVGSYVALVNNGIMLGSFQYFFHTQGLLFTSFMTIWIHGTIEISSIVIAGGAGITLGNGFLFPGNLTRKESLKKSGKRGTMIILGLIPMFIIAGFLESFVTRHVEWPIWAKGGIILASSALIIGYFVVWPILIFKPKKRIV